MQVAAASSSVCAVAAMQLLLLFSPIAVAQLTRITDGNINSAVSAWTTNSTTATTVYGDIGGWNVAAVTSMYNLFFTKKSFDQNIGGWNTASVSNMDLMFSSAAAFNQNVASWNTAKVSRMDYMFYSAAAFNQDIGGWNTA